MSRNKSQMSRNASPPLAHPGTSHSGGKDASGPAPVLTKESRINRLATIVLIGFALSWFYCYYNGTYLRLPYPKNTFLFVPGAEFTDFYSAVAQLIGYNPYLTKAATPGNYFPFANLQTWLFTLLPMTTALELFLLIFAAGMLLLCGYFLKTNDRVDTIRNIFVLAFLSYPFLFCVDRSNFECLLFVHLVLFLIFYVKRQYLLSSVFLSFAIAMKLFPIVFLLLFIADKRYKETLYSLFLVVILSAVCLLPTKGGLEANLNYVLSGFSSGMIPPGSIDFVTDSNNLVQRGMSLFTLLKMMCIWGGRMDTINLHAYVLPYYAAMCATGALVAFYVIFSESDLWKKVSLLTLAMLLFPHMSADYKLIHLFLPLCLYVSAESRFKYDRLFVWLFGLLLIPKGYYYFQSVASDSSMNDISIAVPINIALLSLMLASLLAEGWGLRDRTWLAQSKTRLLEHLGLARGYALPIAALALIGCGVMFYAAFGMRDYKTLCRKVHTCAELSYHGKYVECLAACDKLIAANEATADVYYIASSVRIALGQYDEAMRAAEKALTLAPDYRMAAENYYRARAALNPRPRTAQ